MDVEMQLLLFFFFKLLFIYLLLLLIFARLPSTSDTTIIYFKKRQKPPQRGRENKKEWEDNKGKTRVRRGGGEGTPAAEGYSLQPVEDPGEKCEKEGKCEKAERNCCLLILTKLTNY